MAEEKIEVKEYLAIYIVGVGRCRDAVKNYKVIVKAGRFDDAIETARKQEDEDSEGIEPVEVFSFERLDKDDLLLSKDALYYICKAHELIT